MDDKAAVRRFANESATFQAVLYNKRRAETAQAAKMRVLEAENAALKKVALDAKPKPTRKASRPLWPNAGLEAMYRRKLQAMVDAMHKSIAYWIKATYKANEPATIAQDARPPIPTPPLPPAQLNGLQRVAEGNKIRGDWGSTSELERKGLVRRKAGTSALEYELTEAGKALLDTMITPANALQIAVQQLAQRWQAQFDAAAPKLAEYFATAAAERSDATLRSVLRDGGFSVKYQPSAAMRDIMQSTVHANVQLIKSIPQKYLGNVEGLVMRSVQSGRDLGPLAKALEEQYGVSKRRAAFIARDQNNKATAALNRTRRIELGLFMATWRHSAASKEPRSKHVAADGKTYDIRKGMKIGDQGQWVMPGEEPGCKCVSIPMVPRR